MDVRNKDTVRVQDAILSAAQSMNGFEDLGKTARRAAAAAHVQKMWQEICNDDAGQYILVHTNGVYLIHEDDKTKLVVSVDESIVSAELDARRELIKLQFCERFGHRIDDFEIKISRGAYKKRHPFIPNHQPSYVEDVPSIPLNSEELENVNHIFGSIQNPKIVRHAKEACIRDLEWKKGIAAKKTD